MTDNPYADAITALSTAMEVTPEQLADDLYILCDWMQMSSNHHSLSKHTVEQENKVRANHGLEPIPDYLLKRVYDGEVFNDILYYSTSRKWTGWGINKNPILKVSDPIENPDVDEVWLWEQTWLEKFGYLNPNQAEVTQGRIDDINQCNERAPKRRHDENWLEHKLTVEVAHLRELSQLMSVWMFEQKLTWGMGDDAYGYLQRIWSRRVEVFTAELEYRTEANPEPRSSKKKTAAAKKDFREASLWLAGVKQIYTDDFKQMVRKSALPFDLHIDYDNLPKDVPEKMPVMKMGYYELMAEFVRWVSENEIDPDSFEGEDAHHLKQAVYNAVRDALEDKRKALARAKNQHVPVQTITSEEVVTDATQTTEE